MDFLPKAHTFIQVAGRIRSSGYFLVLWNKANLRKDSLQLGCATKIINKFYGLADNTYIKCCKKFTAPITEAIFTKLASNGVHNLEMSNNHLKRVNDGTLIDSPNVSKRRSDVYPKSLNDCDLTMLVLSTSLVEFKSLFERFPFGGKLPQSLHHYGVNMYTFGIHVKFSQDFCDECCGSLLDGCICHYANINLQRTVAQFGFDMKVCLKWCLNENEFSTWKRKCKDFGL